MLTGSLVGKLGELADQLFKHVAHPGVVHAVRVQIDVGELLQHQIQQPGLGQALDLGVEVEALEDVARLGREALHVGVEILADVVLVARQRGQIQLRDVVEARGADDALEERIGIKARGGLLLRLGQHLRLGGGQHAVQAPQHGERQDDAAVFGLLVIAAQQIGNRPDEGGQGLLVQRLFPWFESSGLDRHVSIPQDGGRRMITAANARR